MTRNKTILILFLFLSTLAVYWPVVGHGFINYDDYEYVAENPNVQAGLTWKSIEWAFTTGYAGNWHPLTWLSHTLDWQLYGAYAGGHHLTNLFFHIVNSVLLFLVLQRMTGTHWRSGFVAALFALHPLHVESVAWASERKDVLSTFFFMLTLWAYARYVQETEVRSRQVSRPSPPSLLPSPQGKVEPSPANIAKGSSISGFYLLALLLFALGLMSKPMLVTLPFVLLLLDFWPLCRFQLSTFDSSAPGDGCGVNAPNPARAGQGAQPPTRPRLPLLLEKLPFFALTVASSAVTFLVQRKTGTVATVDALPLDVRFDNVLTAYVLYLRKMIWPLDLAPFYPYVLNRSFALLVLSFVILLVLSVLAIVLLKRLPYFSVGWFWYLGTLVPVIGLVQVGAQSMADRYSYIPLIGPFIIVVWGAADWFGRHQRFRFVPAALGPGLLVVCAAMTAQQVRYWKNSELLFRHAVEVSADNYIAHHNLGATLAEQGKVEDATTHFAEAVRINPGYAQAQSDLGFALFLKGKVDEAIEHYHAAIQTRPWLDKPHYNLGRALAAQGKQDDAIAEYREAVRLNPAFVEAHGALAGALADREKYEEAIFHFTELLRLHPNDAQSHFDLAAVLNRLGKTNEAANHYALGLRVKPEDPKAHENLGVLLAQQGNIAEAIIHFTEAARLQPSAQCHYELGLAFVMQGNRKQAVEHYRKALELMAGWPVALNDLAWILATAPETELRNGTEAVRLAEQACKATGGQEARFLGTLDAAYAETGSFGQATQTAERARDLARAAGQKDIAEAAEKRLELYRSGRPFRQESH